MSHPSDEDEEDSDSHKRQRTTSTLRDSTYNLVQEKVLEKLQAGGVNNKEGLPAGVVGLTNLGNTCFMNSSLQCLSHTIPLTDYFLGYNYQNEINQNNPMGTGGKLVTHYAKLVEQMWLPTNNKSVVVNPSSFKEQLSTFAPQFSGYHQQDAQELLAFLLDGIHEDLNRVQGDKPYIEDRDCDGTRDEEDAKDAWKNYLRRNKSLVVDLFQGQFRNTLECQECGHRNIRFEPFMYLSLPLSETCQTLEACLDLYTQREDLTGDNQWYCERCARHVDATRKIDLWITPPILIVHLKRFKYDDFGRVGEKNTASLEYPMLSWDLTRSVAGRQRAHPLYDLYAVANHMGGLTGGHYTAHALNRFDDCWYEFNDSSFRLVEPDTIKRSSSAYLLFYNRSEEGGSGTDSNHSGRSAPLIRRQSVSRPDLWPHSQVRDADFRSFRRSSTRSLVLPSPSSDGGGEAKSTGEAGLLREISEVRVESEASS